MMFEKYSYKVKFKALLVIFCMLSFTAYKRSFGSLVSVVKENKELNEKTNSLKDTSKDVNLLTSQLASIDKIIGKTGVNKEKIQQDIVGFISKNYGSVSIFDLKSIHEFSDESYKVFTNEIDVTGSLSQLLPLAYDFEKKFNYSRLVSMNFYTTKKNNENDILHLKLIFQNYENNK